MPGTRTPTRYKPVRSVSATYLPTAECQDEHCTWAARNQAAVTSGGVTEDVKQHVGETGHQVVVERVTRDRYVATERKS